MCSTSLILHLTSAFFHRHLNSVKHSMLRMCLQINLCRLLLFLFNHPFFLITCFILENASRMSAKKSRSHLQAQLEVDLKIIFASIYLHHSVYRDTIRFNKWTINWRMECSLRKMLAPRTDVSDQW